MALLTHAPSRLACSKRPACCSPRPGVHPSQLTRKSHRRQITASSSQQPSAVASAAATAQAPTQQQQQQRIASVSVDLGAAVEQVSVSLADPNSRLVQTQIQFPLGLVLERVNGEPVITEVSEGSAAETAGCRVGDIVRATTAMTMQMTYPTMNIMFGGVGRPKLVKMLLPTSKASFPKVLDAVRSNSTAQGGDGSITLILERCDSPAEVGPAVAAAAGASAGGGSSSSDEVDGVARRTGMDGDREMQVVGVFDPKIFE